MNEIIYPQGCKDIQIDIPNDELIRRLKVNPHSLSFSLSHSLFNLLLL